jgi:hypothetical protein
MDKTNPAYYQANGLQTMDIIEAYGLNYPEGNVLKYLLRWRKKNGLEDLLKAKWYLERTIENERANNSATKV